MKKLKRILCIIMSAVILVTAPVTSYIEAQAVEVIALPFLEDLLLSLGISFGLGEQLDFWKNSRNQALDDYISAAANGETVTLPEYGEVDFSDSGSINLFLDWCENGNRFLLGNLSIVDPQHYTQYQNAALMLDKISYHNTGTSATNAMNDSISEIRNDYNGSSEALAESIQECFTVIQGGGNFNDDDDDDEEKIARRKKFWKTFSAITAAGMMGFGNSAIPIAALKECADSQFNDYDFDTIKDGFQGSLPKYSVSSDPKFETLKSNYVLCSYKEPYGTSIDTGYYLTGGVDYCGVDEGDSIRFYAYSSGNLLVVYLSGRCVHGNNSVTSSRSSTITKSNLANFNGPLFSSVEEALNYFKTGDTSGVLNLNDAYHNFKQNVKGAGAVVGNAFANYIGSLRSLADIPDIVGDISGASNTYGGTAKALEEVADILNRAAGIPVTNPDPDVDPDPDPGGTSNYFGILGRILTAINNLPISILNAFVGKFMTAERLVQLLNNLPLLFVNPFTAMFNLVLEPVIGAINLIPAAMLARLIEIFPNSVAVGNAIIGFPDAVAAAVRGISFNVPEIKIPTIEIPEIKIPEIVMPDINVEINPAITFDPSYNITVENDYIALGNIISDSVDSALNELLVPDQDLALERIDDMKEYFEFANEIKTKVGFFADSVMGIEPSPYLHIPLGKVKSSRYSYGFGEEWVIDCTWYIPYKDFGDKIIVCLFWAVFFWELFVKLPGVISGASGSINGVYSSWYRYLDTKGPARIEGKKG